MEREKIYALPLRRVYPGILNKALKKGRSEEEFLQVVGWLTGYDKVSIDRQLDRDIDYRTFFDEAPAWNPDAVLIRGVVCKVRVETIEDPVIRRMRSLDKLVDELAKGKAVEKIIARA